MNTKVVIIWGVFIFFFGAIGLFGLFNQDLLVEDDQNPIYVPTDDNDTNMETKICSAMLENGSSSYKFNIGSSSTIEKVTITYSASTSDIDSYQAASNLSNTTISGVNTVLSGGTSDFVLITTINMNELDTSSIDTIKNDLNRLSIYIDKITNYDVYKQTLNANSIKPYSCD